jgi:hypothetical protein
MRLAPDAGQAWLRPGDPAHARMLRHLGARALHEPLLAELPVGAPIHSEDPEAVVALAGRALRALLPGQPKPVAVLTRSPEVTLLLLRVLTASGTTQHETRAALAAQVLFSLALSSALTESVTLTGPLVLQHSVTRRGLVLPAGQRLALERDALLLGGMALDPWGPELGALLTEHHGFAVERGALDELGALGDALHLIAERDPHAESLAELFVALEVAPSSTRGSRELELPLAIGRARLPPNAPAPTLARALLRESALHKLTLLRLIDPLVHDEAALPPLLHRVDAWAGRRLALDTEPPDAASSLVQHASALTRLGQQLLRELA